MVARDDDDAWSRDAGPRYDGSPIRVGLPPVAELEFFGDDRDAKRTSRLPGSPDAPRHHRRRLARTVPRRRRAALPGSVGRRTARRVRRLPGRATGLDPSRGPRDHPQRREVHGGTGLRRAAPAAGAQGPGRPAVAAHGRARAADHRHHLHRRRGARPTHRLQHHARPLHPFRQSARSAGCGRPARRHDRRPTVQRDAARPALSDDTVLQLAAQILDEPRAGRRGAAPSLSPITSEEPA